MSKPSEKTIPGINIQAPISQLIVSGQKTVETRTYPIPKKHLGKNIALIETPGKSGKFKARIIAVIRFQDSFKYRSKAEFYRDRKRHCVHPDSDWKWTDEKPKWGWPVKVVKKFSKPLPPPKSRGIVFATGCRLS